MGDTAAEPVRELFSDFLHHFSVQSDEMNNELTSFYESQIIDMINVGKTTLYVQYDHIEMYDEKLASAIQDYFYRFDPYLRQALFEAVKRVKMKVRDIERSEKIRQEQMDQLSKEGGESNENMLNPVVDVEAGFEEDHDTNTYFIAFVNLPRIGKIRDMKTATIGKLISIRGTVTRSSEVRPELLYGSFICTACGTRHPSIDQQFQYTEPHICSNTQCTKKEFQLIVPECVFVDWQRLRVQENADEIPAGSMPRCIDVICRNDIVELAKAGDKMIFTGYCAVVPDTAKVGESTTGVKSFSGRGDGGGEGYGGLKALGVREFNYKMLFIACTVEVHHETNNVTVLKPMNVNELRGLESFSDVMDMPQEDQEGIVAMRKSPHLYSRMADSICPTVHGHSEVKRGVLLMMLGGVHKTTHEGINLRGDINVCIVGDPSCAKSQFLKYVHGFLPRSIYTSGKSSSAAGLTASVVRDSETGEYCIEAGALMLADNGICMIDEFDKMGNADQVAIHEAMEQQTISITKAGIQATLNARTSILAAANPVFGRYDRTKPLKANVAVSAPIMSRFDLFFIIVDESNPELDESIARHIIGVHQAGGKQRAAASAPFSTEQLQKYIRFARTLNPQFTEESEKKIVECYRLLRQQDILGANKTAYRITVRQLESLVRLSEALARLHLDREVRSAYVLEALRLLQKSIISVESAEVMLEDNEERIEAERNGGEDDDDYDNDPDGGADLHPKDVPDSDSVCGLTKKRDLESIGCDKGGTRGDGEQGVKRMRTDEEGTVKEEASMVKKEKRKKAKVSMELYREVTQVIVIYLKKQENNAESGDDFPGKSWKDVMDAYLGEHARDDEDKKRLIYLIIRRMVKQDGLLVEVGEYAENVPNEERRLRLHPSYHEEI